VKFIQKSYQINKKKGAKFPKKRKENLVKFILEKQKIPNFYVEKW